MDNGRKKIWLCVLAAVTAAVVIGVLYSLSVPQEQNSEGFLIRDPGVINCAECRGDDREGGRYAG